MGLAALIPKNSHRGGAAGFRCGEYRIRMSITLQAAVQLGQCFLQRLYNLLRQHLTQVRPGNTGAVGRLHTAGAGTGPVVEKISHQLGRSQIATAACIVGCPFDFPLPVHTRQGAVPQEILRIYCYQQGRVGILSVPVRIAHAVGDHPAPFGSRRHHITAGAHAEGVHTLFIQMLHQLIVRRGQHRIVLSVLSFVDH